MVLIIRKNMNIVELRSFTEIFDIIITRLHGAGDVFDDVNNSHLYYIQTTHWNTYNLLYRYKELKGEDSLIPTKALMINSTY